MKRLILVLFTSLLFSPQANSWTVVKNFEAGAVGIRAQGPDGFDGSAGSSRYTTDFVVEGNQSGSTTATAGQTGFGQWGGGFNFPAALREGDEIWFRTYFYFPPGFDFTSTGMGLKTMRIHTASSSGQNEGFLDLLIRGGLVVWSESASSDFGANNPGGSGATNASGFNRNSVGSAVPKGSWHVLEQYVKLAAKPSPGIYRVWQNGKLVFEDTKTYTLRSSTSKSDFIYLFTYWNGGAPKTQKAYIDDIIITSDRPNNADSFGNPFIGTGNVSFIAPPMPPLVN